jgi:hypothetical protein
MWPDLGALRTDLEVSGNVHRVVELWVRGRLQRATEAGSPTRRPAQPSRVVPTTAHYMRLLDATPSTTPRARRWEVLLSNRGRMVEVVRPRLCVVVWLMHLESSTGGVAVE